MNWHDGEEDFGQRPEMGKSVIAASRMDEDRLNRRIRTLLCTNIVTKWTDRDIVRMQRVEIGSLMNLLA